MYGERERTQSYFLYMWIHRYIQRDLICGMTYSFICIFVVHVFICVPWWSMYAFTYMVRCIVHLMMCVTELFHTCNNESCTCVRWHQYAHKVLQCDVEINGYSFLFLYYVEPAPTHEYALYFPHTYACVYNERSHVFSWCMRSFVGQDCSCIHSYVWHDSFVITEFMCVTGLFHTFDWIIQILGPDTHINYYSVIYSSIIHLRFIIMLNPYPRAWIWIIFPPYLYMCI